MTQSDPFSAGLIQRYLLGARPRTLPASIAPVMVGCGLALSIGTFKPLPALAALIVGVMIQIGTNLINDVIDYLHGTDHAGRLGPMRVTQAGLLSPRQVWIGVIFSYGVAALAGVYLIAVNGILVIGIGFLCLAAGILYSVGPFSMSRTGLGDLFAILFFGFAGVCGTVWVASGEVPFAALPAALCIGVLVANILIVNNIRDIQTDQKAGRTNIAIRFGRKTAETEYALFLLLAYTIPLACVITSIFPVTTLLYMISVPTAYKLFQELCSTPAGRGLNIVLANTARLLLVYAVLLSIGFSISSFF